MVCWIIFGLGLSRWEGSHFSFGLNSPFCIWAIKWKCSFDQIVGKLLLVNIVPLFQNVPNMNVQLGLIPGSRRGTAIKFMFTCVSFLLHMNMYLHYKYKIYIVIPTVSQLLPFCCFHSLPFLDSDLIFLFFIFPFNFAGPRKALCGIY